MYDPDEKANWVESVIIWLILLVLLILPWYVGVVKLLGL